MPVKPQLFQSWGMQAKRVAWEDLRVKGSGLKIWKVEPQLEIIHFFLAGSRQISFVDPPRDLGKHLLRNGLL